MFLQNTQQRNLSFRGQLTDFVKEEGAFFRKLEPAQSPLRCPRKGPLLMTKQLRCNQRRGDCSTIHANESTRESLTALVNRASDQLFACACLTSEKNSGIRARYLGYPRKHDSQGGRRAPKT